MLGSGYPRAIGVYLLVRLVGVAALALAAAWHEKDLLERLTSWDGQWYLQLARFGYDGFPEPVLDAEGHAFPDATLAFFPLYPAIVSGVGTLPGISLEIAALLVSTVAGAIAACGLVRLARLIDPRPRVGLVLVALYAGAPMAVTLSMAYTEALFTACAVWSLVFVLERQWIPAGGLCLIAGLVRSTATALIVAVVLAALVAAWRGQDRTRALVAAALAPLGLLGFWAYVAERTASLTGWQDIEWRGWNTRWDWGQETADFVLRTLATGDSVMDVGSVLVLFGAVALTVAAIRLHLPWPLIVYGAAVVLLIAGTAGLPFAKPRFLLPAMFVLLIPLALELAGRRRSTMIAAVAAAVALGSWYSAYALTGWAYAI
ncbi:hypothetical protein SAMN05216266_119124 [Amycolatopsis marina]|uniref:Dolichyl-phosphate-mannose-protein mannosyltransferase n=1 Tax=Amycolatopsis marina TaxID=490629 RepID=A0A1I1C1T9_9PSEU|nr:hypothetical protein SAMN05216266_119124 [Amycolatopsis marina]